MRSQDRLAAFVADALRAGHSRARIEQELTRAGWSAAEVGRTLETWADSDLSVPVPRPSQAVSAREAFVYGLMFIAFAVSLFQLANLGFALIDRWIPDPSESRVITGSWRVRSAVATLAVFLPLFLWLNGRVSRATAADRGLRRSAVRDWLSHGAMLVAALALLGDLITILTALLGGDLTLRFLAKSVLVAVLAGLTLVYFRGLTGQADAD